MMKAEAPVTEIVILPIAANLKLDDVNSPEGSDWKEVLNILKQSRGYQRLYWGRQVETPGNVQLHIARDSLQDHLDFKLSPAYGKFDKFIATYVSGLVTIRHAIVSEFSPGCSSLGKGSPVTGTAIYLSTKPTWDAAWANWVSIVQHVPGFLGIAGGPILEPVDGHKNAFIALVGWENVEAHNAYHHTQHFKDRRRILLDPCEGYNYYGHIAFGSSGIEASSQAKL